MTFSKLIKSTILNTLSKTNLLSLVLLPILIVTSTISSAQGCGDTVLDPGGNSNYPNNQNWVETYTGGTGDLMEVSFVSFQTESNYDFLYIYDGTSTNAPLLATFHGSNLPPDVQSSSNNITIQFTSDGSVTRPGFELTVNCIPDPNADGPCNVSECSELYSFDWFDGTTGAVWPINNGESFVQNVYSITGSQGTYHVTVTLDNPDGQNVDFDNCTIYDDAAYTGTCNDPNGTTDCDNDPGTNNIQFTYGCTYLTFGVTSDNSDQYTAITYDFDYPAYICDLEIGDIDFSPTTNPALTSYQDEVEVTADSMGVPVNLYADTGSAVDVFNNNTPDIQLLADMDSNTGGDVLPDDIRGHAYVSSEKRVTSITFKYSNGPEDDGLSNDHAIRLSGFSFCPTLQEVCGNGIDDDQDGYDDEFDPNCPSYAPFACDNTLYQSQAASAGSDYFLYQIETDPIAFNQLYNLTSNGVNTAEFNALAFNPNDRLLYGINPSTSGNRSLFRINADGLVQDVGDIVGISGRNEAGCIDSEGTYYVTGPSQILYSIDIANLTATVIANLGFTGYDMAINPANGLIYIWDSTNSLLKTIDPTSGSVNTIGAADTDYSQLGSFYFNSQGDIIAYGDYTGVGAGVQETLLRIDPTTGVVTQAGTGPSSNYNDGCSCAFGIDMTKSAEVTEVSGTDVLTYTFTIFNRTGSPLTDINFSDILTDGLVWASEPFDVTGLTLGTTGITGSATADFIIESVPVGESNSFKLSINLPEEFCGEYVNQASLSSLGEEYGNSLNSDDPNTADISDATTIVIDGCESYFLEVECGSVGSNWNLIEDATASGGTYATINPGVNSYNVFPPSVDDQIIINVDVATSGTYYLFARVRGSNSGNDSFWFRANGSSTDYKWNSWSSSAQNDFTWLQVYDSDNFNSIVTLNLNAGMNTIDIGYREDGAHIDKIFVSPLNNVPTGDGGTAINCIEICDNGIDDNNDGLIDCEDGNCAGVTECQGPCSPGELFLQRWTGITGSDVLSLTSNSDFPNSPDEIGYLTSFQGPNNYSANYGTRVSGYIIPSETGTYSFNVTGDDGVELRLSTSNSIDSLRFICEVPGWTNVSEHNKFEEQTSDDIELEAGVWYFVELLHKEGNGGDHFQVYWQTPSNSSWSIVPSQNLAPSFCPEICVDPIINVSNSGAITCTQLSSTLSVSPSGLLYNWNDGNTSGSRSVTNAGTYTVTVSDFNGCTSVASTTVTIDNTPPSANAGPDDTICEGESTTLTASGLGSYQWSTGSTNTSITVSPLSTTTYTVTVTGANGCTDTDIVQVIVSPLPVANVSNSGAITCSQPNATLVANPSGMNYQWHDGNTNRTRNVNTAGEYRVTVTDGNGCTDEASTTVTLDNTPPTANAGPDDTICEGESSTLTASGLGSYQWSTGSTNTSITVSPSSTTIYTVTVTGANGCTDTDMVQVTVNDLPIASVSNSGAITCSQPNATLVASPSGMSYQWQDGNTNRTRSVNTAGEYRVTVTDGNGCTDEASTTVTLDNTPPNANAGPDDTICEGESTTLTASGLGSYQWSTGSTNTNITVSPSSTTIYTVTVTGANGCTDTDVVEVTVNPLPILGISHDGAITCNKTNAVITATPAGLSYLWSDGSSGQSRTVSDGVEYFVTVTNGLGCASVTSLSVPIDTLSPSANAGSDEMICIGESTTLTAIGVGSYVWSTGSTSSNIMVSPSSTTTYTVTVTGANGCTDTDDVEVVVNPLPSILINNDGPITCNDTIVTLTANPSGADYLWSTGETTASIDVTNDGTYTVEVTDGFGCRNTGSTTVSTSLPPVPLITGPVNICIGETTTLTPGFGGEWSSSDEEVAIISNSGNVVGVSGGIAVFTFEDTSTGCTGTSDTIRVSPEMNLAIDFIGGICLNDDSQLGVIINGGTPNYSYSWSGPDSFASTDSIIDITLSGNYYVTITDAFGCTASVSGYIYDRYDPYIFSLNTEICEGETIDLSVNSGTAVSYLWGANADNATTSSVTVTPSPPSTDYTVMITNDLGCTSEATVTIDVIEKAEVLVTGETLLCAGEETTLSPSSGGTWTSTNNSIATVSPNGVVTTVSGGSVSFIFTDSIYSCSSDPTLPITILDLPNPIITGPTTLCVGDSTTLSPTSGGLWTSSNSEVATIDDNGLVVSVSHGTVTFTFENSSTGCVSNESAEITINQVFPIVLTGDSSLCVGETTFFTPTSGGTWISSDESVATINNIGVVTANGGGVAYFTFESDFNCISPVSQGITVTEITDMTIAGPTVICEDEIAQLTADVASGTWSSSNSSIVSIDAVSGEYVGVAEGSAIITYSQDPSLCINDATYNVEVRGRPNANLDGSTSLCVGDLSSVSTSSSGGNWFSTNDLVAVVSDAGVVVGVSAGEAAFIYEAANGCFSDTTAFVTVHPEISVDISFNGGICLEDDTQLTANISGGSPGYNLTWVGPGGFTSDQSTIDIPLSGNYTVTVVDTFGCSAEYSAFVYERYEPFLFTLNTEICEGEEVTLSINGSNGGSFQWSANAGSVTAQSITVTPPVPSATYVVTVTNDIGCETEAFATIDVNPTPIINLTGNDTICNGSTTEFTSSTDGTWTSSNYSIASINSNGLVTAINPGTAVFTFRDNQTGCYSDESQIITINPNNPIDLFGDDDICLGVPKTMTASEAGGVWSSNNTSIATVDPITGEVTPVSAGSTSIVYSVDGPKCLDDGIKEITVRNLPSVNNNGPSIICEGDVTFLVPTSGGSWVSSDEDVATVNNLGIVTGLSGGTAEFTFTSTFGCVQELGTPLTVVSDPVVSNSGPSELCINETAQLTSDVPGLWISSNNLVASVSSQGLVTAKTAGTANFSFIEFTNGCQASNVISITVNGTPNINGLSEGNICIGETASITPSTGGTWASSDTTIAIITDEGLITGIGAGAATFTYTDLSTGCVSAISNAITVEGKPIIIEPANRALCVGETTNILPSSGGSWSTSDVSVATIDNGGTITAISAGTVEFTYTNNETGCISDVSESFVISNPSPATISGELGICIGETTTLIGSDLGSWSSNNNAIGTIDNSGQFTAVGPGIVTVTLTTSESCVENPTFDIQVNPKPITSFLGSSAICIGGVTNLSPLSGGIWESSDSTVAEVTDEGIVTAIAAGSAVFTFTDTVTMCSSTTDAMLNVFGKPEITIAGDDEICIGGETSMSPSTGGIWTSTDNTIASISTSGLVNGISPGTVSFIFTEAGTGCVSDTSNAITVLPKPIVFVAGNSQICQGDTSYLSPSTGGVWSSDNESVAIVNDAGVVVGVGQGIARFTFISDEGCVSNQTNPIIVFGSPTVLITDSELCINESIEISPNAGGTWMSSDESIATITDSGIITGVSSGEVSFFFTDTSNGCTSMESGLVTVNPAPDISVIGSNEICIGGTTNLVPSTGGWWTSLNPSIATIENNGTVTGIETGTARFVFTQENTGCNSDTSEYITVVAPIIPSFTGNTSICIGDTTYITPNSGGAWISTNEQVASISNDGMIIGLSQGLTTFQFIEGGTNCTSEESGLLTVNGAPSITIEGSDMVCIGATTQLVTSNDGIWESLQPDIAVIDTNGIVTGLTEGVAFFTFTDGSTGCITDGSFFVTIQADTPVSLVGDSEVCVGYTTQLSPSSGGFWVSNNPEVASITNSGVVTGIAPGKASFEFTDAFTGCVTETEEDIVSVSNCTNHDFNVTTTNLLVEGNLSTNDNMPLGTTYSGSHLLIEKPNGSIATLIINSDGTYQFTANNPGNYRYNVPVCGPTQSAGCPTTILEVTVVTNIYSEGNPVGNIDLASTYSSVHDSLSGTPVVINAMANDKCVYTAGCDMDYSSMSIINMPSNGTVEVDTLGNITYTPEAGFVGYDTIHYEVCADGYANCNESMQVIIVNKHNASNSIVASDDFEYAVVGNTITGNVMLNDMDPEGDEITVQPQGSLLVPVTTADGSYYIDNHGDFTFTPNSDFNGSTEIIYTVCDDNLESVCTDATLHILVFDDIAIQIRLYLEGSLMNNGNAKSVENKPLMRDDLRNSPFTGENYIPLIDPYSTAFSIFSNLPTKYNHLGPHMLPGNTTIEDSAAVFSVTGDNAIVDWIHVELRSKDDYHTAFATRSGLIQRDGDVVDLDGVSPLRFQGVNVDSFYVVINHRSHLGVMTKKIHYGTYIDLTDNDFPLFDYGTTKEVGYDYTGLAMKENYKDGYRACWAGDFDVNGKVKFSAPFDDQTYMYQDVLFSSPQFLINYDFAIGYYTGDFDMNSKAKYDNPNDDKNFLFAQLLFYPLNFNFVSNFDLFVEQVPPSNE